MLRFDKHVYIYIYIYIYIYMEICCHNKAAYGFLCWQQRVMSGEWPDELC